ncbi:MAG: nuclear transport factor 2 family protein [Spirochaetes bacterium]|nr:nuclear transport factor 2 family protein [Spirochaetota bacterium]MBN2772223.1 nuclear transport factor 2 family protein [Spirochaetota bacterium]
MEKPMRDYIEGWYDKDEGRMKEGLHDLLAKRHPDNNSENGISSIDLKSLLYIVPQFGGQNGKQRRVDITVLDSLNTIATAKVVSNEFIDYVHLVFVDNRWKIINVLWDYHDDIPMKLSDKETAAVKKPVQDYVEGWYDKDAERIRRGLHPDLAKRSINPKNSTAIDQYSRSSLLEVVQQYGGQNGDERILEIELLDVQKNIASAKVVSNSFVDYVHLCYADNQWLILNVLWAFK